MLRCCKAVESNEEGVVGFINERNFATWTTCKQRFTFFSLVTCSSAPVCANRKCSYSKKCANRKWKTSTALCVARKRKTSRLRVLLIDLTPFAVLLKSNRNFFYSKLLFYTKSTQTYKFYFTYKMSSQSNEKYCPAQQLSICQCLPYSGPL